LPAEIAQIITSETNVYDLKYKGKNKLKGYAVNEPSKSGISNQDSTGGEARDIIRQIQNARKEAGCELDQFVAVKLPAWPEEFEDEIKKQTLTKKLIKSGKLEIVK